MRRFPQQYYPTIPQNSGFTLIELVIVIVLMGILSAVAVPRFTNKAFEERGFHDVVKSALQHARHVAVASRRFVCVEINSTDDIVSLTRDLASPDGKSAIDCAAELALPSVGRSCVAKNQVCAPSGVSIDSASTPYLTFDPLGRLVSAPGLVTASASILINNQAEIMVIAETGYIQ